jgi:hypothetical protein
MAQDPKKLGNNTGKSILPVLPPQVDFIGPNYDYGDELLMPDQIGVRRGNKLSDVFNAARGVNYYTDMIGFGEASSPLTRGMSQKPFPMGINYFMRTNTKCSNGPDMWVYMAGVPDGSALGTRVRDAMKRLDMPLLRGLAPGIIEDAKAALNPTPVLNTLFGSGYAKCKQVTLPVGDTFGRLQSQDGKNEWIRPLFPGDIKRVGGMNSQTRWVFDRWLTQEEWQKEWDLKDRCPDGSRIANHVDNDCNKPLIRQEGFENPKEEISWTMISVAVLLSALVYAKAWKA